jgi:predicted RNase H-like HicB family nuclease
MVAKEASDPLKLTIVYERAEQGWTTATIPALPGTISAGRNRREARDNVLDALRLMLATPPETPRTRGHVEQVEFRLDLVRHHERGHGR